MNNNLVHPFHDIRYQNPLSERMFACLHFFINFTADTIDPHAPFPDIREGQACGARAVLKFLAKEPLQVPGIVTNDHNQNTAPFHYGWFFFHRR